MGIAIIIPDISFANANLGSVTLRGNVPITGLGITGPSTVSGSVNAAKYLPMFTPTNTTQRGVIWSITSGNSYASINSSTGELTILSGALNSSVTIRATSSANSSIIADKAITVSYDDAQHATPNYDYSKNYPSQSDNVEDIFYSDVLTDDCIVVVSYDLTSHGTGAFIFTMNTGSSPYQGINVGWNRTQSITTLELTKRSSSSSWTKLATLDNTSGKIAIKVYKKEDSSSLYMVYSTDGLNWSNETTIYNFGSNASCACGYRIAGSIDIAYYDSDADISFLFN